jgi:hypothetical protein
VFSHDLLDFRNRKGLRERAARCGDDVRAVAQRLTAGIFLPEGWADKQGNFENLLQNGDANFSCWRSALMP